VVLSFSLASRPNHCRRAGNGRTSMRHPRRLRSQVNAAVRACLDFPVGEPDDPRPHPEATGDAPATSEPMAAYLTKPVLVVDDSQTTVRVVRSLLTRIGFMDIDDASNGMAALAKMVEKPYGIVIADWNMEPMSGYELLKQVRANSRISGTRLILMTAELNASHVIAAKKAGASNYILKPFTDEVLRSKIEEALLLPSH